ncbi:MULTISPECIES: hypothetical protein [unclassified Bacteroides]|uniref:hypothetical protein n=1 Tax=unclassified Bacteroides TaxID=2646097 RepID=UPI0012DFA131|nr:MULTISPECIES: hypothetical protein [unclassified Bacteroides]
MRKSIIFLLSVLFGTTTLFAQRDGVEPFKNLSVGLNIGILSGVGIDAGTYVSDHVGLRAGFNYLKTPSFDNDFDAWVEEGQHANYNYEATVKANARVNLSTFKVLADYYPNKKWPFHVTGGFYIGASNIVTVDAYADDIKVDGKTYKREDIKNWYIDLDDTRIKAKDGKVDAAITTWSVKPYVGIGFGNTVPMKHRVGVMGELGVMFHGKPKITSKTDPDIMTHVAEADESDEFFDVMHKIVGIPVLSIRICGRIF